MEMKLNGPAAIVGVFVILAFGAYRVMSMQTELETEALDELRSYLAAEYAGRDVAELSAALESDPPVDPKEAQAHVDSILATQDITFPSVSARGFWDAQKGGEAVVQVDIRVAGGPPPDGESTRYYRMRYRPLSGWHVLGRTSAWSYRLKLF